MARLSRSRSRATYGSIKCFHSKPDFFGPVSTHEDWDVPLFVISTIHPTFVRFSPIQEICDWRVTRCNPRSRSSRPLVQRSVAFRQRKESCRVCFASGGVTSWSVRIRRPRVFSLRRVSNGSQGSVRSHPVSFDIADRPGRHKSNWDLSSLRDRVPPRNRSKFRCGWHDASLCNKRRAETNPSNALRACCRSDQSRSRVICPTSANCQSARRRVKSFSASASPKMASSHADLSQRLVVTVFVSAELILLKELVLRRPPGVG